MYLGIQDQQVLSFFKFPASAAHPVPYSNLGSFHGRGSFVGCNGITTVGEIPCQVFWLVTVETPSWSSLSILRLSTTGTSNRLSKLLSWRHNVILVVLPPFGQPNQSLFLILGSKTKLLVSSRSGDCWCLHQGVAQTFLQFTVEESISYLISIDIPSCP